MYAVIETGGKQYRVQPGDVLDVEKLALEGGGPITFDRVLAIGGEGDVEVGQPRIAGAVVTAELVKQLSDRKVVVFKMKRRKGSRRKQGHRQRLTRVRILEIKPTRRAGDDGQGEKPKKAEETATADES